MIVESPNRLGSFKGNQESRKYLSTTIPGSKSFFFTVEMSYGLYVMSLDVLLAGNMKEMSIKSRFISSSAGILPGPLLDLLGDLVDVLATRYDDPPPREKEDEYTLFQTIPRNSFYLRRLVDKYPFRIARRKPKHHGCWSIAGKV